MKKYNEIMKAQRKELEKRVDSTHDVFTMDVNELPKEKYQKFAGLHNIKGTTTIMGEKI